MNAGAGNINFGGGSNIGPIIATNIGNVNTAYNIDYGDVQPKEVDAATLAGARAQLAAMPLDTIPDPAPLPHGSHLPLGFIRNAQFVGRAGELKALAQAIKGGATTAIGPSAAVTGMGGLGKTQLANELVHRYGQFFAGGVVWLNFAQEDRDRPAQGDTIRAQIAACHPTVSDPAIALRLMLAEWQSPLPRLLVFDNCEDEQLLQQWRPPGSGSRVLVTSRRASWNAALGVERLALHALPRPESIQLLRKHRPDLAPDDPDLDAIADEVGDLPLALTLAGSFLALYKDDITPDEYLQELRASVGLDHESFEGEGISPTGHDLSIARTIRLSYDRLDPADTTDALALKLLARAAGFAPGQPIPRDLLKATLQLPDDDKRAQRQATRALKRLTDLGLLEAEAEGALRMHRLVAAFVRAVASDAGAQAAVEDVMIDVAYDLNNAGDPRPLLELQTHLRHVTDAAEKRDDNRAATLCTNLGYHLNMIGDYAGAKPYYARALAIREQVLGAQHPDTATSLNNLGGLLQAQGDLAGAKPYYVRALAIREQVLGAQHPDTATSLNNLGGLLQAQGDLAGAKPYYVRALAIYEQVLGAQHPDTATSLNNLGGLLQAQGKLADAQPYFERALAIDQAVYGPNHPEVATDLNNLGYLLQEQGKLAAAQPYYERALAIREQVLGDQHPDTAQSLNNLATLNYYQGNLNEAARLMRRALAIFEQVLGSNHPDTQRSRQSLAVIEQRLATQVQTVEQQIAEITQRALAAVEQAEAEGSAEQRAALAAEIEAQAQSAEDGEAEGSPYLALATRLRALAARLRRDES